ncbi:MAG: hypothetical protein E6G89_07795 [Alphaproteobacteria bacterium]|nr:MAG: hypothetical protein E6G89_07795 [Alphaproteobacteria bacterium]
MLKAMGKACAVIMASKGQLNDNDRCDIADRIVAGASAGETSVEKLVALAVMSPRDMDHPDPFADISRSTFPISASR